MGPENEEAEDDELLAAIEKAYDEVEAKTPAEAEPAQREPTKAEAEPAAETAAKPEGEAAGQPRDESGRFKAKEGEKPADKQPAAAQEKPVQAEPAEKAPEGQPQAEKAPAATPGGPPASWSIKAKAAWDALPDAIKAEVAKRESEVAKGFGELRESRELKPYADIAAQQGTTVPRMLQHYTQVVAPLERALRADLGSGLAIIAQNAGLSQQQAAQLFAQLAQRYGGQPASQSNGATAAAANAQPGNELVAAFQPLLAPVLEKLGKLESDFGNRVAADRNAAQAAEQQAIRQAWAAVSAKPENRFAKEVQETVVQLLDAGIVRPTGNWQADLQSAYDTAVRMNPEIQEALIEQRLVSEREAQRKKEQEAAAKAKAASRSVTGNRSPGTVITERKPGNGSYHDELTADIEAAYNAATAA